MTNSPQFARSSAWSVESVAEAVLRRDALPRARSRARQDYEVYVGGHAPIATQETNEHDPIAKRNTNEHDPLADFERRAITLDGVTKPVYLAGTGPAVIVMAEMPGISPEVARFARWVRDAGFTVWMPSLFGRDGAVPDAEEGVRVTIGEENPVSEMRECTLVTSAFLYRDHVIGILGVVGPRRLPYRDVIAAVNDTARHVSDALSRVRQDLYLPS